MPRSADPGGIGQGLARTQRLRSPDQFAALAGDRAPWRQSLQWIAAAARLQSGGPVPAAAAARGAVRFGFTVGRRQARRAVQRNLVRRVMREAARMAGPSLAEAARGRGVGSGEVVVDVVMRLRSALPDPGKMTLAQVKRALRQEANVLMARLASHLNGSRR